jgi:hypothetical protein
VTALDDEVTRGPLPAEADEGGRDADEDPADEDPADEDPVDEG